MSQGSNYKKEVMEALSMAPTNLITNKAFLWAASNLPDEGGVGKFTTKKQNEKFDHDSDDIFKACGLSDSTLSTLHHKLTEVYMKSLDSDKHELKKSNIIESLVELNDEELNYYLMVLGLNDIHKKMLTVIKEQISSKTPKYLQSEKDIPDDLPEEIKALLRAFIDLKNKLGGDSDTIG